MRKLFTDSFINISATSENEYFDNKQLYNFIYYEIPFDFPNQICRYWWEIPTFQELLNQRFLFHINHEYFVEYISLDYSEEDGQYLSSNGQTKIENFRRLFLDLGIDYCEKIETVCPIQKDIDCIFHADGINDPVCLFEDIQKYLNAGKLINVSFGKVYYQFEQQDGLLNWICHWYF